MLKVSQCLFHLPKFCLLNLIFFRMLVLLFLFVCKARSPSPRQGRCEFRNVGSLATCPGAFQTALSFSFFLSSHFSFLLVYSLKRVTDWVGSSSSMVVSLFSLSFSLFSPFGKVYLFFYTQTKSVWFYQIVYLVNLTKQFGWIIYLSQPKFR